MTTALTFSSIESGFGKRRALSVVAAIFIAIFAAGAAAGESATGMPVRTPQGNVPTVGAFTGRYANGLAVYRLPPVTVVASRKAELAKWEREEQRSRVRYGRADYPAHREN